MQNFVVIIVGLGVVGIIVYLILSRKKEKPEDCKTIINENAQLKADLGQKDRTLGELTNELQNEKTQKDQLFGKNKQLFVQVTSLEAEKTNLLNEKESLIKEISNFRATENSRKKESDDNIKRLDEATIAFGEEKQRVRREDEERLRKEREEKDRMWAEHEENVKNQLTELCKSPQYGFKYYDNNNLPTDLGGKFKPDFLIEFLEQYVIFDAKVSESDLQNYINVNVKSTVQKINGNAKIYSTVFFVVPTEAMKSLKKIRFYEQIYEFFVIPPEAIEAILASLKKISSYELAQQLDPRDRENIVNIISEFDYHINMRNAYDILASESGVSILKKASVLKNDIKEEIRLKKETMRLQQFGTTDIKTLMVNTEIQEERINELTSPKAAISDSNIKTVKPILRKKN
ncbi:MAG: hypothetical protein UW07_C0004G0014 [Candidatus Nomurabacteria bacterium GW2011_GWF2_43_8]|uniref:Uncharacterized protein n=3 Tax=Candidatus Nomuraibacteriota TaxID=1752729 RepID=A0A0G1FRJ3_9BACT|nr:MAG: hypothetical protein UV76_C0007G0015 [Candidatus Nomurabacteria bacterium GW2011_GWA2_43_15]KKT19124.1 MAG: hypothetical protein UW02_C0015G0028 [Candidatus Nomurabacteria bacterium GW2011_GWB1_43_7]KKT25015.1 MAG: hypothetical protein UW07_C0004G0014 [Candidatus Nomurabacteria bacterium GW2011_GWF2_43_8]